MQPAPEVVRFLFVWSPTLVYLLFMGVAGLINKIVGRKAINSGLAFLFVWVSGVALLAWQLIANETMTDHDKWAIVGYSIPMLALPLALASWSAVRFRRQ